MVHSAGSAEALLLHGRAVTIPSRFRTTLAALVGSERRTPTLNAITARDGPAVPSNFASQLAGEVKDVAQSSMPSVATAMRYRDVGAASDWLCAAFGFQKHLVATNEAGVVHYAQLTFGDAMLMLAAVRDGTLDRYMKQPDEIGGAETQSCYLLVSDADAHYARAKASGARIILEIQDDDFGGRSYACRDPESHIWNFGTYDPWQGKRADSPQAASARRDALGLRRLAMVLAILAAIVVSAVAGGMYGTLTREQPTQAAVAKDAEDSATRAAQERLNTEASARVAAERAAQEAKGQLDRERLAREAAESVARGARQELDQLRNAKQSNTAEPELDRERAAREAAERAANQARELLNRERSAKNAALRTAAQLRRQLVQAQNAKQAGEGDPENATAEPKSAPKKQKGKAKSPDE
jgi:uncharacterized glyoxalase superfamily protein PhnB